MYNVMKYGNIIYISYVIYILIWKNWIELMKSVIKVKIFNQLMNAGRKTFGVVYGSIKITVDRLLPTKLRHGDDQ